MDNRTHAKEGAHRMKQKEYRGYGSAPRWMGLSTAIKNSAFAAGLSCEIDVDKGFITESVRFTLRGPEDAIDRFAKWYRSIGENA